MLVASLLQPGDLVFHRSRSDQAAAIAQATGSELTHVGIVFYVDDAPVVLEAVQPVKTTPLDLWVARGSGLVVKRHPDLDADDVQAMRTLGWSWRGRPYDAAFRWDDERLYCSELVYKLYDHAGLRIGRLRPIADYALHGLHDQRRRRGLPLDRRVVTPADLAEDAALIDVDVRPAVPGG